MRRLATLLVGLLVLLGGVGLSQAGIVVQATFTGDNVVQAFYKDGSAPVAIDLAGLPNLDNWRISDTKTLTLDWGKQYQFIFRVFNNLELGLTYGDPGNPAGFLAEIEGPGVSFLTSSSWKYALDDGTTPSNFDTDLIWADAVEWGYLTTHPHQGGDSHNGGNNIWGNANGTIAGISTSAHWIWGVDNGEDLGTPANPNPENWLWLKGTITTPIPEPCSLIVWSLIGGFGIGGAWLRRKKRAV